VTTGRLLVAGLLGSVLITIGGWGSGALPPGQPGWGPGTPVVVVGVLLLGGAWWRLRAGSGAAAVLWSLPLLLAPPLFSRDVYAYAGQAALVVEGLDPYTVGPSALPGPLSDGVDEVWRDVPSPYGPLWLVLAGVVVRLTGERLVPALAGLRLLAVLGLLLAGWAVHRLGGQRAVWLGVANPLVLLHLVGGAHNEALMLGLALAGLAVAAPPTRAAAPAGAAPAGPPPAGPPPAGPPPAGAKIFGTSRVAGYSGSPEDLGRLAAAAVLVTLGALVKLPIVVVLPFLVMAVPDGWPARLRAAAVVLPAAAVTAVLVTAGTGLGWGWLGTLDTGTARLSLLSVTTGLGLLLPGGAAVLGTAQAAGLLLAAGTAAVLLRDTGRLGAPLSTGLALLVGVLLLPVVQPWYLLWGVLPLAAAAGPRLAAAVGALCLAVCLLVEPSGRHVVRPPLYGLPTLLAVGAAVLVWRTGAVRETTALR